MSFHAKPAVDIHCAARALTCHAVIVAYYTKQLDKIQTFLAEKKPIPWGRLEASQGTCSVCTARGFICKRRYKSSTTVLEKRPLKCHNMYIALVAAGHQLHLSNNVSLNRAQYNTIVIHCYDMQCMLRESIPGDCFFFRKFMISPTWVGT